MDYNQTVHLPQTDFPMRAGLPKREPEMLQEMYDHDLYHKMVKRNEGKPTFVLHDGPPYANGNIHIGTALNKILKDMIVKHRNMTGWCAPYVPGWDTHGLPIESAVLKDKKVKRDEMTTAQFRTKCREYAESYIEKMTGQFQRLGVLGEWENPYITLLPEFEAKQIEVFGKMAEKGLIYKGMKPVYWCPFDQTALAEAEIEYADDPCTTIFVKFPVADDKGKLGQYADLSRTYFVIWTTTPWTIPGNYAICLNAEFDYVLLQVPGGDVYVLAKDLAESVCKAAGIDYAACTVLATLKGSAFELMRAKHPLFDRESVILNGEHVTLDAGSGCVHTAPGFGAEDFQICQQYDKAGLTHIGVPVPVNAKGVMTDERYNGQFYAKGNDMVVADLEAEGFLVAKENITHSYPHCWRCKHPIIYRATEQWFCSVDAIKDAAVKACDSIQWKPEWGKERMTSMITERNDWCISRQRVWGVPIPIFYCDDCGADIVTPETIAHVAALFREHGSNVWFDREAADLLPQGFVCPKCGKAHFTKETDIMDVWFDSGSTWAAVAAERPYLKYPADLYLEGGDQYRGWFQSSMLTSIAVNGVAPYKQIATHGWTVDGEGKAMHKSLGNAVSPDEVIKDYGADMLRLWVASADYTQDMRISKDIMKQLSQAYLKIRNTARYMLGNLCDFEPDRDLVPAEHLMELDRYALHTFNELAKTARAAYDRYEFHAVYRAVYNFCVVDMSNFYLDIIKDRLYCGAEAERRSAQTALYHILDGMTRLIAPILAFTSDEIWHAMRHAQGVNAESVLFNDMPSDNAAFALDAAARERWAKLVSLRDAVNKALENARNAGVFKKAQDTDVTLSVSESDAAFLAGVDLASLCIVSKVTVTTGAVEGEKSEDCLIPCTIAVALDESPKCPRCWNHSEHIGTDGHHNQLCDRCAAVVGE
ncbi:MAG: isoleucine--tRNA ligase [Flavonifractor plautii]|jgi:isoleucyl-tRNA synthetase|uniref:isoleucine--tRNA ligase n=1 Tax=Flavonifractor plautii TaxID=292800 RepID=UPI00189A953C|nr:isoleucine--tRNA ligase [Flavonifractor plautii]MDB7910159.1 isoleucine--tRNA ligase [Flavonifractor plautii]MDB7913606.1 isoleucine--tRNA ligase [Flavonifractor plautii]